jgi:Cdc6-like AAA superfamily ATPase
MSKQKTPAKEDAMIHTSHAIQLVAKRLVAHEQMCLIQFKALEEKIGEQDTTFTESEVETKYDSLVDLIRNLNKQIVALTQRCEVLEKQNNIKPTKKKGTMPLAEVGDTPSFASFSTEE